MKLTIFLSLRFRRRSRRRGRQWVRRASAQGSVLFGQVSGCVDFSSNGYRNHIRSYSAGCKLDVGEGKVCGCEFADRYVMNLSTITLTNWLAMLIYLRTGSTVSLLHLASDSVKIGISGTTCSIRM